MLESFLGNGASWWSGLPSETVKGSSTGSALAVVDFEAPLDITLLGCVFEGSREVDLPFRLSCFLTEEDNPAETVFEEEALLEDELE